MKRLIDRSRSLVLVVALAVVAAMCTVSTANAAPSASAAPHEPAASSTQCKFMATIKTCESTDPTVSYTDNAYGNTSDCTFVFGITWGDNSGTTTITVTDPTDGPHLLATHRYAGPRVYTITVNVQVTAGNCTGKNSVHTFTLDKPPTAPPPAFNPKYTGYATPFANQYHYVGGTWHVPTLDCLTSAPISGATQWVGLGGVTIGKQVSTPLVQIGIVSYCVLGKQLNLPFWEVFQATTPSCTLTG